MTDRKTNTSAVLESHFIKLLSFSSPLPSTNLFFPSTSSHLYQLISAPKHINILCTSFFAPAKHPHITTSTDPHPSTPPIPKPMQTTIEASGTSLLQVNNTSYTSQVREVIRMLGDDDYTPSPTIFRSVLRVHRMPPLLTHITL